MFVHWLEIGSIRKSLEVEDRQWKRLENYIKKYPDSKTTVYNRNSGDLLARIVKLECNQRYKDLDIDCNSMFDDSIKRLERKPYNIELCGVQTDYFFKKIGED